jgi:hypothetical protein
MSKEGKARQKRDAERALRRLGFSRARAKTFVATMPLDELQKTLGRRQDGLAEREPK